MLHKSINTLPIRLYINILETGKLTYLGDAPNDTLVKAWNAITKEITEINLKEKAYNTTLLKDKLYQLKKIKAAISGNSLDKMHFNIAKAEREAEDKDPFDFEKSLAILEEKIGQIDDNKMSVKRYLHHMNLLKANGRKKN